MLVRPAKDLAEPFNVLRVADLVADGQHYRTANSGRVQKCDEVTCFDPFKSWGQLPDGRTKKVLMVIHQWRRLPVQKRAREHGEPTAKDSILISSLSRHGY